MKLIVLVVAVALAGWWMWTSMGGSDGVAAMPGGGPKPTIDAAQSAVDTINSLNATSQKAVDAARAGTDPAGSR